MSVITREDSVITREDIKRYKADIHYTGPLPRSLERVRYLMEDYSDERGMDAGYWLYLREDLINELDEFHMVHEDTLPECLEKMKLNNLIHCTCEECLKRMEVKP